MLKKTVGWILGSGGIALGIYLTKNGDITMGCVAAYLGGVLQVHVLHATYYPASQV